MFPLLFDATTEYIAENVSHFGSKLYQIPLIFPF